jgi:hypothetical protein
MSEVEKIHGLGGPKEPEGQKNTPSGREFRELMKQDTVRESEEQHKGRGAKAERSEKEKAEESARIQAKETILTPTKTGKTQPMKGVEKERPVEKPSRAEKPPPKEAVSEEGAVEEIEPGIGVKTEKPAAIPETKAPQVPIEPTVVAPPAAAAPEEAAKEEPIEKKEALPIAPKAPEKKEGIKEGIAAPIPATPTPALAPTTPSVPIQPYIQLSPEMLDLFDRMIGVMRVMSSTGVRETTINLTSERFANSIFFGAQIVIREYSTAPRAFNIEILGTQRAVAHLQGHIAALNSAFQRIEYNFSINRVDVSLLKAHRVQRKGKAGEEENP